jgi:hypothetical protein
MRLDTDEHEENLSLSLQQAITLIGATLFFSSLIFVMSTLPSISTDLPSKLAVVGMLVGSALWPLPEYLHLRLWPFLGLYLAVGIVGVVLAPSEVGLICIFVTVMILFLSLGLRWWKIRQGKRV